MTSRAPPYLLTPYLAVPPPGSLTLLTNVLSATSNWLVIRYLQSLLPSRRPDDGPPTEEANIVLVSFLRDYNFWNECAGKLGIDLTRHGRDGNFVFVDGLTGLFIPPVDNFFPVKGRMTLSSPTFSDIKRDIQTALTSLTPSGKPIILIIDQLDALVATTEASVIDAQNLLLSLRQSAHSTILTISADDPFISEQHTTLEKTHAALTLELAHQANVVISLRMLDTGIAKDVSGVARITRGGQEGEVEVEEHEYLYYVGGDGGVRVVERGTCG